LAFFFFFLCHLPIFFGLTSLRPPSRAASPNQAAWHIFFLFPFICPTQTTHVVVFSLYYLRPEGPRTALAPLLLPCWPGTDHQGPFCLRLFLLGIVQPRMVFFALSLFFFRPRLFESRVVFPFFRLFFRDFLNASLFPYTGVKARGRVFLPPPCLLCTRLVRTFPPFSGMIWSAALPL